MELLQATIAMLLLLQVHAQRREPHRPCSFNPLCMCTNSGGPDLGSVCCHDIPFMTVPSQIHNSAIYTMSLKNNNLRYLEDNSLNGTGLFKLEISSNLLTDLPPDALSGLGKTLKHLDLSNNNLIRIPREAMQNLDKLSSLSLSNNQISFLHNDDLRIIGKTLKELDLSQNALIHIQTDVFRNMISLEILNLANNAIITIDDVTFQNGLNNLKRIILAGNQLQQIPLNTLSTLRNIKIINLNHNMISSISEGREIRSRIYLEELHLENNLISELTPESFRLFNQVNRIFLKGNPLSVINDTFVTLNSSEIYMSHCKISVITNNAFFSVKDTLQVLDLSYNNLSEFPNLPFTRLNKLQLRENELSEITTENILSFSNMLKHLDIRGPKMVGISEESISKLSNLRELLLNKQQPILSVHLLSKVSSSIEKLTLVKSSIKKIENGAFQKLKGIKYVDISHNKISKIENNTLRDVRHSLEKLILHNALKMNAFPYKSINNLKQLEYLDISSNNLLYLPHESFSTFQSIKNININHNNLKALDVNFVNYIDNPELEILKIAFNKISVMKSNIFRNQEALAHLQLNDNRIETLRKAAFLDLESLLTIRLEGNLIEKIENEAFQNLPKIQFINLSYNKLQTFNLEAFNQVGRLSTLQIDVDHNNIKNLSANYTAIYASSNVKTINFSHNNISLIDGNYFEPIRPSITSLDLSHNKISNLTSHAFINMASLQILLLSNNMIDIIDENEFSGLLELQILDISRNFIKIFYDSLFEEQKKLRILGAAYNSLEILPKNIFGTTTLEQLDLSFNNIIQHPEEMLFRIKDSLQSLDLSGNQIMYMNFTNFKHLKYLRHLNISGNKLLLQSTAALESPKLISLDLSHNIIQELPAWIANQLPLTLETLNLANTSLHSFPAINACNILQLNLSTNFIRTILPEELEQLKKIQILDISNNLITSTFNNVFTNLQNLKVLYLQNNPIKVLLNNSFNNMERLQQLFLKNLYLEDTDKDAFQHLTALRKVEINTLSNVDMSELFSKNQALRNVHFHFQESDKLKQFLKNFPKSLESITMEGESLKTIPESLLASIQSPSLDLIIRNTSIARIHESVFKSMEGVKNISISFVNNKLESIGNIYSRSEKQLETDLKNLQLHGNQLRCSCEMAWIWEWLEEYEYENYCFDIYCEGINLMDLRKTMCVNMNNRSIIDVFNIDLECFPNKSSCLSITMLYFIPTILLYVYKTKVI